MWLLVIIIGCLIAGFLTINQFVEEPITVEHFLALSLVPLQFIQINFSNIDFSTTVLRTGG